MADPPRQARPRRVLVVVAAPTFGGAVNQVLRLHGPLLERGWELVPVLPLEPGNAAERLHDHGIPVLRTSMHRARATRRPGPHLALARHTWGDIGGLRALIRSERAAVVQNHGDLNPQAGIAGNLEGAAVHWQLLDSRTPERLRHVTRPMLRALADSFTVVGRELANVYGLECARDRVSVVYAPADPATFAGARARRAAARAELGVPEGALCVGAIGNRNPQKGHEWLVRAVARAREFDRRLVLRILGAASPGHEDYELGLHHEAAALGLGPEAFAIVDPGARVPELIGAFDLFCMSSVPQSEGIPTVILEAMLTELPVVATDVGAVSELVVDGVTGRVVKPLSPGSLAEGFLELAADPALGTRWGRAGYERVLAEFGVDRLADLYAEGYAAAVAHRAGRRRKATLEAYG